MHVGKRMPGLTGLTGLLLVACSEPSAPPPNPHDSKYEAVTIDDRESADCVRDSVTGLTWELKSDEPGLRDWRNTYTWFNPGEAHKELDYRGLQDGGQCTASDCDTWDYVMQVNATAPCGYTDWRLPIKDEFFSITDLSRTGAPPTTNTSVFRYAQAAEYWTANDYSFQHDSAWAWNFQFGHDRVDWKRSAKYVRLVRGTAGELEPVKE